MWIEGTRLQVIDSALERGRRDDVEKLLADIFRSNAKQGGIPTTCPTCRRDLVRNALPGVGLYVSACPDRHGAWMTNDDLNQRVKRGGSFFTKNFDYLRCAARAGQSVDERNFETGFRVVATPQ